MCVCEWNTTHAAEHSGYYKSLSSLSSPSCDIHARVLSCSTCILLCKCTHIMDVCQNSVYGWKRSQNPPFSILFFSPQLYEEFRFPSIHQFGSLLAFQAYGAEVITIKQYFGGPLIFFRIKSLVARSEMCKLKFHFWSTGDDNLYKFWAQWDRYISKNAIKSNVSLKYFHNFLNPWIAHKKIWSKRMVLFTFSVDFLLFTRR